MRIILMYGLLMAGAFYGGCLPAGAVAQEEVSAPAQFFSAFQDIPLMPGLTELPEQGLAFDKPEGRIIEAVAAINQMSEAEVRLYYDSVLPRFGWLRINENSFIRGDERLQMGFESYRAQILLRMSVTPR